MEQIPNIVKQRLAGGGVQSHPDPNLLAAFAENTLRSRERAFVLEHLALCFDCREIVLLAQPAEEFSPLVKPQRASWFSWPVLRWGAAVACVAVVGAAISLYRQQPEKYSAQSLPQAVTVQTDAAQSPAGEDQQQPAAEPKAKLAVPATPLATADRKVPSRSKTFPAHSDAAVSAAPEPTNQDQVLAQMEKKQSVVQGKAKEATAAESGGAPATNMAVMTARAAANDISLASTLAPRWTLNADGTLQRSLDGGKSWNRIEVSPNTSFRVVSALGPDVWVGGGAGSLFHSADAGEHWSQVKPSDGKKSLVGDVIAIQFTDSTHGRVTTAKDEVWSTDDGGTTWQQLW